MSIIAAIIILGVLIFIHELGHFTVAKLCGVYVEKFSLGFGPRLFGKKYGETDYCVSAFPLGGYVKMYGEQPGEEADPSKSGRSFSDKSAWQRAAIIIAGPAANLLLAVIVFWGLFMTGFPAYSPVIGSVKEGSPAYEAGLAPGDAIASIDGRKIRSWSEFQGLVSDNPGKTLSIVLNDGKTFQIVPKATETANIFGDKEIVGDIGASLSVPPVIGGVQKGSPAAEAGIKPGDRIISVNDIPVTSWNMAAEYIRARPGEKIDMEVERGKTVSKLILTPKSTEVINDKGETVQAGLIGINPQEGDIILRYGFAESLKMGFEKSYEFTKLVLIGFVKLIERAVPADSLGGPIMIVQMAAQSAQSGLTALLIFMSVISVNLAVFNLLPIPVLDGGHLLIIAIEAVTRRKLSERTVGAFQTVGFALLMGLMIFAFYNDLARIFFK